MTDLANHTENTSRRFLKPATGWRKRSTETDTHLYKLFDEAGIDHFCMHALRHTYATRAIESGMQPKVQTCVKNA